MSELDVKSGHRSIIEGLNLRNIDVAPTYRRTSHVSKSYVILFTPRSGSTWLTRRISACTLLGCPDEYFNLKTFEASLCSNPSKNIYDYYDNITAKVTSPAGIFGLQIGFFDLEQLEKEVSLLGLMTGEKYFFQLKRNNFVAQAVSMYLAEATGRFHVFENQSFNARMYDEIIFDVERIKHWARHILQQEYGIARWLERKDIRAPSFTYEGLVADINGVVRTIAQQVDCVLSEEYSINVAMSLKLSGIRNAAFEALFRDRCHRWCSFWENARGLQWCD